MEVRRLSVTERIFPGPFGCCWREITATLNWCFTGPPLLVACCFLPQGSGSDPLCASPCPEDLVLTPCAPPPAPRILF